MEIIKKKHMRIIKQDLKSYENSIKIEFKLSNKITNLELNLVTNFFQSYVRTQIIDSLFKFDNKFELSTKLSGLSFYASDFSNRRYKSILFDISFFDFEIENNINKIIEIIQNVFKEQKNYKLSQELEFNFNSAKIALENISSTNLKQIKQDWKINLNLDYDTNTLNKDYYNLFINSQNNYEEIFSKFILAYNNILNNLGDCEIVICGQVQTISDEVINLANNLISKEVEPRKLINFETNLGSLNNIKIKSDTSKSLRYLGIKNSSKKQEYLNSKLLTNRLYKFYVEEIRGIHNLIYSPSFSAFVSPNLVYKLAHEVKPNTLDKMIEVENEFFENRFFNKITTEELEEIKLELLNQALNLYEKSSENTMLLLIELYEQKKLVENLNVESLYKKLKNCINLLNLENFKTSDFLILTKYQAEAL